MNESKYEAEMLALIEKIEEEIRTEIKKIARKYKVRLDKAVELYAELENRNIHRA